MRLNVVVLTDRNTLFKLKKKYIRRSGGQKAVAWGVSFFFTLILFVFNEILSDILMRTANDTIS